MSTQEMNSEVLEVSATEEVVKTARKRREITKNSVSDDLTALQTKVEEEINSLKNSTEKVKGVKFLRSVNKALKTLTSDYKRVMKMKPKTKRNNENNGFMKPVRISEELANFLKVDPTQLISRVDVTRKIRDYINAHHLKHPDDKRKVMIENDLEFCKLLRLDPVVEAAIPLKDDNKCSFFLVQRYIKPHFPDTKAKAEETAGAAHSSGTSSTENVVPAATTAAVPSAPVAAPTTTKKVVKRVVKKVVAKGKMAEES